MAGQTSLAGWSASVAAEAASAVLAAGRGHLPVLVLASEHGRLPELASNLLKMPPAVVWLGTAWGLGPQA